MSERPPLIDAIARERFRNEWNRNFAVSANAGSGKTTAISERLASMALAPDAAPQLKKTAVVTFTKKAAAQIGQRARAVLLRRLAETPTTTLVPLDHLEHAFFGTIHSFCLLLAQRYGQMLGLNLDPAVIAESDESVWEEFIEQDEMQFTSLAADEIDAFLRHVPLEEIFGLARLLDRATAARCLARRPTRPLPVPSESVYQQLLTLVGKGVAKKNILASQQRARNWQKQFRESRDFLPLYKPAGKATALVELADAWMKPLKAWLADAGATLAAELAERYRAYRFDRGVQTYADQIEAAIAVLNNAETLEKIREEGWRIILDEAQDTDSQQFAVLVEITRPEGAVFGSWPQGGGSGPRQGHFCMVGDGQQAIYGSRSEIRNFTRHLDAFARGDGGELLTFRATFRTPRQVIAFLNTGLPAAFGRERIHNLGLPPAEDAPSPLLQVKYEPLEAGPENGEGWATRLPLSFGEKRPSGVGAWQTEEARQIARFLKTHGPGSLGARNWGEVCVLAPRNEWLVTARRIFEHEGLKVALQMRRNRNADNPVYAWVVGLLTVICDPENIFEWFGVLREIFAVSDAVLAEEFRDKNGVHWDDPEDHAEPLRAALEVMRPWILRANDEGQPLTQFVEGLVATSALEQKAWALDASGGLAAELDRLRAEAAALGLEGAGPREWQRHLLDQLDEGRPLGKPEDDAINLMTAHSAKGLEWPVVIPLGLWRPIGKPPESGLRLISGTGGQALVVFDNTGIPDDTREARERERLRELVRLLYVTLTRARSHLVIPWHLEFGGKQKGGAAFAELWGGPGLLDALPALEGKELYVSSPRTRSDATDEKAKPASRAKRTADSHRLSSLPRRVLPHQLAGKADLVRASKHESSLDELPPAREGDDAIDYGLWWHETMEFLPWESEEIALRTYRDRSLEGAAQQGFSSRGEKELQFFFQSETWRQLNAPGRVRLAELSVLAPLKVDEWIDGVIDLVIQDDTNDELWVIDWKTNRRRAGESDADVLARVATEYEPQLQAYGQSLNAVFPSAKVRLWIYATGVGDWLEITFPKMGFTRE